MMIEGLQLNSAKRELPPLSTVNLNCAVHVSDPFHRFYIGLYFDEAKYILRKHKDKFQVFRETTASKHTFQWKVLEGDIYFYIIIAL